MFWDSLVILLFKEKVKKAWGKSDLRRLISQGKLHWPAVAPANDVTVSVTVMLISFSHLCSLEHTDVLGNSSGGKRVQA